MFPFSRKLSGTIMYDPYRGGKFEPNWCIVDVDKDLTRYYRWWLKTERHVHLHQPSWDAHITLVKGEYIRDMSLWKKYHGHKITVDLEHGNIRVFDDAKQGGKFYTVRARSTVLCNIRQELGLRPEIDFHVTVGRSYY